MACYDLLSGEILLKMLKADDHDAFKEIYKRHWRSLFVAAQRKISSDETAEELVQNVFLSLWEKRYQLIVENLPGYLSGALKYQIIDHYRRQLLTKKYNSLVQERQVAYGESPEESIHFRDITEIFEQIFSRLPEKTSHIFHLSRVEHKTTRQISQELNIPERTVEYHITQSLKILRQQLSDYLPFWATLAAGENILSLFQ